jgi:hypothetical protein
MQRLKLIALVCMLSFGGTAGSTLIMAGTAAAASPTILAASSAFQSDACQGLSQLNSAQACGSGGQSAITKVVKAVVNVLGIVLGIAGVIMVIVSGFKYITSGGDSGAVSSAKRTLIYALVGLVIAALAKFLVHFVINTAKNAT